MKKLLGLLLVPVGMGLLAYSLHWAVYFNMRGEGTMAAVVAVVALAGILAGCKLYRSKEESPAMKQVVGRLMTVSAIPMAIGGAVLGVTGLTGNKSPAYASSSHAWTVLGVTLLLYALIFFRKGRGKVREGTAAAQEQRNRRDQARQAEEERRRAEEERRKQREAEERARREEERRRQEEERRREEERLKEMVCPACGKRFPLGQMYCDECGSRLKETP